MAASYSNIGVVTSRKGDLENALLQLQRALEIQTRVFGSEHPDVAASCNNIGAVYEQKGDLENALLQQQKAREVFLAVYGQEPQTWPPRTSIGATYLRQGEEAQGFENLTKANDIDLKMLGPDHPDTKQLASFLGKQ